MSNKKYVRFDVHNSKNGRTLYVGNLYSGFRISGPDQSPTSSMVHSFVVDAEEAIKQIKDHAVEKSELIEKESLA